VHRSFEKKTLAGRSEDVHRKVEKSEAGEERERDGRQREGCNVNWKSGRIARGR
jgi:hypothetical protein